MIEQELKNIETRTRVDVKRYFFIFNNLYGEAGKITLLDNLPVEVQHIQFKTRRLDLIHYKSTEETISSCNAKNIEMTNEDDLLTIEIQEMLASEEFLGRSISN